MTSLIHDIESEAAAELKKRNLQPLGVQAVHKQHLHTRSNRMKKSPAPRFHAATKAVRQTLWQTYAAFVAAFREAAEKLKSGDRTARFPLLRRQVSPARKRRELKHFDGGVLEPVEGLAAVASRPKETHELATESDFQPGRLNEDMQHLTLPPGGYAIVKSMETFMLSDKVLGIIGPVSDFIRWGLELVHSPFIDPIFHGQLELGLSNRLRKPVTIALGQPLGKVSFFDISDTYPIDIVRKSAQEEKFRRRIPRRDDDPVPLDEEDDSELQAPKPWNRR